jgi:tRNA pseudouridine55 synthase
MFGFLNIHKPPAVTSRDVVNRIQRVLPRKTKIGHAGTLDPLATGVLVICIGPATRLVPFIHEFSKSYHAEFQLGVRSDTDDISGQVEPVADAPIVPREVIEAALPSFRGRILQTPPQYSAIQIGGRRAYDLARAGESVELQPREMTVHRLELVDFDWPRLTLDIECSSGTYIRSIGRDLGERLSCGGVMTTLVRTAVGPFRIEDAIDPNQLTRETILQRLIDPLFALPDYPRVVLSNNQIADFYCGRAVRPMEPVAFQDDTKAAAAIDESGKLIALCGRHADGQRLQPTIVFESTANLPR